jgi:hypothetical protein
MDFLAGGGNTMKRKYSWPLLIVGAVALMTLALGGEGRLWGQKAESETISAAAGSFVFTLTTAEQSLGEYSACSGLGSSNDIEEQMVVAPSGVIIAQKIAGALQWQPIRLKCDGPGTAAAWQWRRTAEDMGSAAAAREGIITMLGPGSPQPIAQWSFHRGWPARLVFDGTQQELVIIHEGLVFGGTTASGGAVPAGRTR